MMIKRNKRLYSRFKSKMKLTKLFWLKIAIKLLQMRLEFIRSYLNIINMVNSNLVTKFLNSQDTINKALDHIGAKLLAYHIWDNLAVHIFNKWVIQEISISSLYHSIIMQCNREVKLHNNPFKIKMLIRKIYKNLQKE